MINVAREAQEKQLLKETRERKQGFGGRLKQAAADAKPEFDRLRKECGLPPFRIGNLDEFVEMYNLKCIGEGTNRDTAKRWFAGERIPSPKYRIDLCVLLGVTWDFLVSGRTVTSESADQLEARQDQKASSLPMSSRQLSPRVGELPPTLSKFVSTVVGSINEMTIEYLEQKRPE